jgi:hypothetical protein
MDNFRLLADGFRARAEEISAWAETMLDADARHKVRGIAAGYEKLAARVEQAVQISHISRSQPVCQ